MNADNVLRAPLKSDGPIIWMVGRVDAARLSALLGLPMLIAAATMLSAVSRAPQPAGPIPLDPSPGAWDSSRDPAVVAQLSDLHVSPIRANTSVRRARESLAFIGERIRPEFTLLTGDLTDNLEGLSVWTPSYPMAAHWRLYGDLIRAAPIAPARIVEVLGNHDNWGALAFRDFAAAALLRAPAGDWFSRTVESDAVRIVTFVPLRFPAGRAIYNFVIALRPEMLDALEAQLERETRAPFTVVASHFPTAMLFPLRGVRSTKSNRNLLELLGDPRYRVAAFVNGHTHPRSEFDVRHHPGVVEITAGAILDRDGVQVLTVDNGRVGYARLIPGGSELAVVTSPASDRLASRVFPAGDLEVRVVSFSPQAKNFTVTGAIAGTLRKQRELPSGATLWALNASLPAGRHALRFAGDLNREINFTVGVPIPPFYERVAFELKGEPFWTAAVIWLVLTALALLSVFVHPTFLDRALARVFHDLNGDSLSPRSPVFYAVVLWPFWPLFIGFHIRRLPHVVRWYAIFLLFSGFLLPFGTTLIDGHLCLQTTFGYFVAWQFVYDVGGQVLGFFYISGIVVASIALLSLFAYRTPRATMELFLCFAHFFIAIFHWERLGRDKTVNWTPLRVSLGFHVIPVVTLFIYTVLKRLAPKKRD